MAEWSNNEEEMEIELDETEFEFDEEIVFHEGDIELVEVKDSEINEEYEYKENDDEVQSKDEYGDELEDEHDEEPENDHEFESEPDEIELIENKLFDLSEFTPFVCKLQRRPTYNAGVLSVIHSNFGKRVELSKDLTEQLGNPQTVQIGLSDTQLVIAENLGDAYTSFSLSESGAKKVIYRSELVKQIIERYELDFTDRTSITFYEVTYTSMGSEPVALIVAKA